MVHALMRLKGLRTENGLRQTDMARLLGISQPTYVQKELGNRPFTQWEIERLLKTFRKKYEEIFAPAERRVNLRDIAWKD